MLKPMSAMRVTGTTLAKFATFVLAGALLAGCATPTTAPLPTLPSPPVVAEPGPHLGILVGADPSVIRIGSIYYSVASDGASLHVSSADSVEGFANAERTRISDSLPNVWAPEFVKIGNAFHVYFASGNFTDQRMYTIFSKEPTSGYSSAIPLRLPDDKWAIDGVPFRFNDQWWFVWSGWEGDTNIEQNLYVARMTDPTTVSGPRYVISQPREPWERSVGDPYINESPQPILDPSGALHIVYSANGSWSTDYCLADLRLRADGYPGNAQDWYKSNGCLFASKPELLAPGAGLARRAKGVGHNSFALPGGDIGASPPAAGVYPLLYHGVPNHLEMNWANRYWYTGAFRWVDNATYCRTVDDCREGWSLQFVE